MRNTVMFLLILGAAAFISSGLSQEKEDSPAPDFQGKTVEGKEIKLSEFKGKVVLLDFWASWCPPCLEEMPQLIKFYRSHNNSDFKLIAVNIDDKAGNMQKFLDKLFPQPQFPVVEDHSQKIPPLFNIEAMPTTIFIDKKGNIRYRHDGFEDSYVADFNSELTQLLNEN
ncbi:MAG TPA: TlpA disulfide reductase family protein [Ignavibacteriaceae bacterium]|jgi:thiol-disulfide isomerase/thioredoxin|nr:TlpA disulfide reductase family protein [Ignavibacteriaceae bacterium]